MIHIIRGKNLRAGGGKRRVPYIRTHGKGSLFLMIETGTFRRNRLGLEEQRKIKSMQGSLIS